MSGREMVIGLVAFGAGTNILWIRDVNPWLQLAFLGGGMAIIFVIVALLDDYDRKCRRDEENRKKSQTRDSRIRKFIEALQIGEEVKFNNVEDHDGYTIHRKKYPGKSQGIVEDITYEFSSFDYTAQFTTSDNVVTTITIGENN